MISDGTKKNPIAAHWDIVALVICVLALIGGAVLYFGATGEDPDEIAAMRLKSIESRKPSGEGVKPADMSEYVKAAKSAKTPVTLGEVTEKEASFLASESRVFCANKECLAPIPANLEVCPACQTKQPTKEKVVFDGDGDGLPDEWEKRYGLNVNDAADADADKDGDGFTNAEEFAAKTDPTDNNDHPDYLDSLKAVTPFKETMLSFYFKGVIKIPAGLKMQFYDPKKRNDYGKNGVEYGALEGKEIGDTGFIAGKYQYKTERRKIKGGQGMEKTVDVSTVEITRKSDGKILTLVLDERRKPVDIQAKLVYERGTVKEFTVVPGDTIDLNGKKYKIKDIKSANKRSVVTVEDPVLGKIKEIEALEN